MSSEKLPNPPLEDPSIHLFCIQDKRLLVADIGVIPKLIEFIKFGGAQAK